MPKQWSIYIYKRYRDGASVDQLGLETGMPAEDIAVRLEAARLCFEKQCLFAAATARGGTQ